MSVADNYPLPSEVLMLRDESRPESVAVEECHGFNAVNRGVYIADNLDLLRSLNDESIDLVNIDPPFKKNQTFTGNRLRPSLTEAEHSIEQELMRRWGVQTPAQASRAGIQWPDEAVLQGGYKDIWSWEADIHEEWLKTLQVEHERIGWLIESTAMSHGEDTSAYLCYMAIRLIEIRRILKPTGSLFLHCDHDANAYLRQLLDAVFGRTSFRNEIVWCYTGPSHTRRWLPRKHDTILFYAKGDDNVCNLDDVRIPYSELHTQHREAGGSGIGGKLTSEVVDSYREEGKVPEDYWLEGRDGMSPVGRLPSERTGYPTQKPWRLAERIVKLATNPGDVVLDCFAGCAYSAVAAEKLGRQWVACDLNPRAWTVFKRQFNNPGLGLNLRCNDDTTGQQVIGSEPEVTVHGPNELPTRTSPLHESEPVTFNPPERKFKMPASLIPEREMLRLLLELSDYMAWCCGFANWSTDGKIVRTTRNFQLDHIDPRSKRGSNQITNRAPLCPHHNVRKSNARKHLADFREEIALAGEMLVQETSELIDLAYAEQRALDLYADARAKLQH